MAKSRKKASKNVDQKLADASKAESQIQSAGKSAPIKIKPKSEAERRKDRIDGIKKTVFPAVLGVLAGFACYYGSVATDQFPWHFILLLVILITYLIQKIVYPFLKVDVASFQGKDWFYVEFMAVDLLLVTWTLLLN